MGTISGDFADETVVVTGASSGIGRAVALRFGAAGATVVNADVRADPKDLDAEVPTHEAVREAGGRAEYVETDVSDPDQIESVVEAAREFGGVDVMVNNAGVHVSRRFLDVDAEDWETVQGVNARGAFFGTQIAARDMLERDDPGVIVNTVSTSMDSAGWEHSHYAASKGAARMTVRSAAYELAGRGIRVTGVAPGATATEITEGFSERAQVESDAAPENQAPPVRAGTPEDIAGAYLYLASEDADYVNGTIVYVDGGAHIS
jgi:NAD(P)-dependent dehydrogenase (short-subunit alcohol dehydrogenase family)